MKWMRSRRGQIVIPAMLMFPTFFLFVFLIYETAKLSREKIRHQFAIDAAAFVEMTNYSDFLNRTAYVNGAFPMRIFEEAYYDFLAECEGKTNTCGEQTAEQASDRGRSYASIMFYNGAFPDLGGSYSNGASPTGSIPGGQWKIEYNGGNSAASWKNGTPPDPSSNDPWYLFTETDAQKYWHPIELANDIYKLYVQVYSLLGSVESAQFAVLKRLTTGSTAHSFLQKSYWLNTGDSVNDAVGLANQFDFALGGATAFPNSVKPICQHHLMYWGNKKLSGGVQPYVPQKTDPPVDMTDTANNPSQAGCSPTDNGNGGLFILEWIPQSMLQTMGVNNGAVPNVRGLSLLMNWSMPQSNYFNVNFSQQMAVNHPNGTLHTTIAVMGSSDQVSPAVWPDPTPKFQVREFP
jgi:hypothetical protein